MQLLRGVIEDNNDPEKIGRVKVRIFTIHTEKNENSGEDFSFVSKEHLPWAEVAGSTAFGLVGGIGLSSVLKQGTWVWVGLEQNDPNKPIVLGTINGKNSTDSKQKYSSGEGFFDPDEVYPFEKRAQETDINRLARNEQLSEAYYDKTCPILGLDTTIHQKINDTVDVQDGIIDDKSGADVSQTEPNSTSDNSEYPNVQVLETESGHVFEFDDTPENERVRLYHRTGSYIEIKPDGTFVQKSVNEDGNNHYIHMSNVNEHVAKSVKKYVEENLDEIIKGYVHRHIQGEMKEHITGNITMDSDANVVWNVGGNFTLKVTGKIDIDAGPEIDMDAGIINLN